MEDITTEIIGKTIEEVLNEEIARELFAEIKPSYTEEEFNTVWDACGRLNPWDVPVMYAMIQHKESKQ